MDIDFMTTEEIVKYLGTRYESLICSGVKKDNHKDITVATFVKGKEHLEIVLDDVSGKVRSFLSGNEGEAQA